MIFLPERFLNKIDILFIFDNICTHYYQMTTLEDVFYLYERNSRYYHYCNLKKSIGECNSCINNDCLCHLEQEVKPFTIGDQETPCDFRIRCYIKPGDECPICYEPIIMKSSAFITNCGHHFHKKCLFKYIETKWLSSSYVSTVRCPMCRCSLGDPDFVQRYRASYFSHNFHNNNIELDKLEDFWISKDYKLPAFCSNRYDHYLGCNKSCFVCKYYIETGKEPF